VPCCGVGGRESRMAMCLSFVSLATSLSLFRSLGDRCTDNAIYQPSASDNVLHPAIDDISRRACAIVQSSLTGLLSLESPTCGCQRTCFLFVHSPASLQRQRSTLCRDTAAASPHLLRAGTHPSRRLRSGAISPDQQATTNSSGIDIDIR
jgi:hypothetical protein